MKNKHIILIIMAFTIQGIVGVLLSDKANKDIVDSYKREGNELQQYTKTNNSELITYIDHQLMNFRNEMEDMRLLNNQNKILLETQNKFLKFGIDSINRSISHIQYKPQENISKKIPGIFEYIKKGLSKSGKPRVYFNPNAVCQVGEKSNFVVTGNPGDIIRIDKLSGQADIKKEYSISEEGIFIPAQANDSLHSLPQILTHPVEGYSLSQRDTGYSQIAVCVNSGIPDTLSTIFFPTTIYYKIDTLYITSQPKQNNIIFNIVFSKGITQATTFDIEIAVLINAQIEKLRERIIAPEGVSEYQKTISYTYGRAPYCFKVDHIQINPASYLPGIKYLPEK